MNEGSFREATSTPLIGPTTPPIPATPCEVERRDPRRPVYVDFVEEPPVLAPALGICGAVSEPNSWLFASCGEDGRRERNELRQFSQILGCGG